MKTATSVLFLCIQIQQLKRENDLQLQKKNERQNYIQTQQLRPTDTATERQNDLQIHLRDKTTYSNWETKHEIGEERGGK